jgi:hypothetical protein
MFAGLYSPLFLLQLQNFVTCTPLDKFALNTTFRPWRYVDCVCSPRKPPGFGHSLLPEKHPTCASQTRNLSFLAAPLRATSYRHGLPWLVAALPVLIS